MSDAVLLETRGLRVERAGRVLVDGGSLSLRVGETAELHGASGGGKSTLLAALAWQHPCEGELSIDGTSRAAIPPTVWRSRVAWVPQAPVALPGTIRDNLLAGFTLRVRAESEAPDDDALREHCAALGIAELGLDRPARETSGGQLARLGVLRAALAQPQVLMLDEAEAMLDEEAARRLDAWLEEWVAAGQRGILRVRHGVTGAGVRAYHLVEARLEERA